MNTPSRHAWRLSCEAFPILVRVRWRLWRTPFPVLHAQWQGEVQRVLDVAQGGETDAAQGGETGAAPLSIKAPIADDALDRATIIEAWNCAHAVARMARVVPLASCLTQAMVLQLLLAKRGQLCAVYIGVERRKPSPNSAENATAPNGIAPNGAENGAGETPAPLAHGSDVADGGFRAHAWVEWRGRVLIGGDVRRWKPLTVFAPVVAKN